MGKQILVVVAIVSDSVAKMYSKQFTAFFVLGLVMQFRSGHCGASGECRFGVETFTEDLERISVQEAVPTPLMARFSPRRNQINKRCIGLNQGTFLELEKLTGNGGKEGNLRITPANMLYNGIDYENVQPIELQYLPKRKCFEYKMREVGLAPGGGFNMCGCAGFPVCPIYVNSCLARAGQSTCMVQYANYNFFNNFLDKALTSVNATMNPTQESIEKKARLVFEGHQIPVALKNKDGKFFFEFESLYVITGGSQFHSGGKPITAEIVCTGALNKSVVYTDAGFGNSLGNIKYVRLEGVKEEDINFKKIFETTGARPGTRWELEIVDPKSGADVQGSSINDQK